MAWSIDARIPVWLGALEEAGEGDALLFEGAPGGAAGESFEATHAVGCECCGPRSPAAVALDRLFQRRVRGEMDFFRRVVAVTRTVEGAMAVWAAVRNDPVASARYRLAEGSSGMS